MSKRLMKEYTQCQKLNNPQIISLIPKDPDNLHQWEAKIRGLNDYTNGEWKLDIVVPKEYPNVAPKFKFVNKIAHPNINFQTGEICLDILDKSWTPVWTLQSTLMAILLLLDNPEPNSPLNVDMAVLFREDATAYKSIVEYYVWLHALPEKDNQGWR